MNDTVPAIAIEPSPANDVMMLLGDLAPTADVRDILCEPEAFYQRYRAELLLLFDLLFPHSGAEPAGAPTPRADALHIAPLDIGFATRSMLR